jgi:hypothetical protein
MDGWKNDQNAYCWAGGTFEVTAFDPFRFYGGVIYGAGAQNGRKWAKREGWFIAPGIEYTGWDVLAPQGFGWRSTGEDKSTRNGSERCRRSCPTGVRATASCSTTARNRARHPTWASTLKTWPPSSRPAGPTASSGPASGVTAWPASPARNTRLRRKAGPFGGRLFYGQPFPGRVIREPCRTRFSTGS